jgi:hypothetical protein
MPAARTPRALQMHRTQEVAGSSPASSTSGTSAQSEMPGLLGRLGHAGVKRNQAGEPA